jgi:hypothetical protein
MVLALVFSFVWACIGHISQRYPPFARRRGRLHDWSFSRHFLLKHFSEADKEKQKYILL